LSTLYQVHEFAALAGVTVRALHHYDRLGLLKPRRAESGYRLYSDPDLERLEQIVALRFLGFSLKQIRELLLRPPLDFREALRLQRRAISERHSQIAAALRAIEAAEASLESGKPAAPAILKKIIEVIHMENDKQSGIDAMKLFYSTDEAWQRHRRYYEEGPSPEWQQIYSVINDALAAGTDPASDRAQDLANRWLALNLRAASGDPAVQTDSPTAWVNRARWPDFMKQRIEQFHLEQVWDFARIAIEQARKKYFTPSGWENFSAHLGSHTPAEHTASWQRRVDLFREIEASLTEDPASPKSQALAARWVGERIEAGGSDPEIVAGMMKVWADRRNWSLILRHHAEGHHLMPFDRFLKCADFLDRAIASRPPDSRGRNFGTGARKNTAPNNPAPANG